MANSAGFLQFVVAATAGQVALAAVLSIMLGGFHRFYRHDYLRHWSLSWLALIVYIVAFRRRRHWVPPSLGVRVPAAVIGLMAGYRDRVAPARGVGPEARRRGAADGEVCPAGAVAAGLASVGPVLAGATRPSMVGVRCAVAAVACVASAVALLRNS